MRTASLYRAVACAGLLLLSGCTSDPVAPALDAPAAYDLPPASKTAEPCLSPLWDPAVAYRRGDVAVHAGRAWRAKKNHEGIEPGSHPAYWAALEDCATDPPEPPAPTPLQIFGVWHAGNHYADWSLPRDISEFDAANHWIIDRGDGSGLPSVNLVVLSFLHPLRVLEMTTDEVTANGVPVGMSQEVVDYFRTAGIRVMMSIGGQTYTDFWNEALAADPVRLGRNAAAIAERFGVGIEIDYEENTDPDLAGLQAFIDAYRSVHPYDPTGANPAARLTIDLAAGGRYLQDLNRYATIHWLDNDTPVLDYANAMVHRASGTPDHWQEHVDGKPTYSPPIPPKAPNRFTGGLYLKGDMANCTDFYASEQYAYADYAQTVAPAGAGTTPGMLGFMFWAAEYPSARRNYTGTVPPTTCEGGMGVAASVFDVPTPMRPLRQE